MTLTLHQGDHLVAKHDDNTNLFNYMIVQINLEVEDKSLHDGYTCLNYDKLPGSYNSCVNKILHDKLMEWLGCIPPWFNFNLEDVLFCSGKVYNVSEENWGKFGDIAYAMMTYREVSLAANCLPPCVQLKTISKKTDNRWNYNSQNEVYLKFYSKVQVSRNKCFYLLCAVLCTLLLF